MKQKPKIKVKKNQLQVKRAQQNEITLPRIPLPDKFLQWQSESRIKLFNHLLQKGANAIRTQPAHLPVLASIGSPPFSINLTSRGIGVLPIPEQLEAVTHRFEETRKSIEGQEWAESLHTRATTAKEFYASYKNFDRWLLGGLEIFEGQTAKNLQENPFASLLYTGEAPRFPSYQFNGVIEFVKDNNPYYHFLLAARQLFAFDPFHVRQIRYPHGYLFHVSISKFWQL
jgi:hypothetical protein